MVLNDTLISHVAYKTDVIIFTSFLINNLHDVIILQFFHVKILTENQFPGHFHIL